MRQRGACATRRWGRASAGTTPVLLADSAGNDGGAAGETVYARGGPGALAAALAAAARAAGVEIRTGAAWSAIRDRDGRVTRRRARGRRGDRGAASWSAACDPRHDAARPGRPGGARAASWAGRRATCADRGVTAKVDLALAGLPRFAGLDGDDGALPPARPPRRRAVGGATSTGPPTPPSTAASARQPWLEATIPSLVDPLLVDGAAASGVRHVMSVLVQSAPYALRDGDWDSRRDALGDLAVRTPRVAWRPGIGGLVVARAGAHAAGPRARPRASPAATRSTASRASTSGSRGGRCWGYARYRMPVEGLYLCGAGAHPGGGVTGPAGPERRPRGAVRPAARPAEG